MQVSCACPTKTATDTLEGWIRQVGLEPIITPYVIRCVYEGNNIALGDSIVERFEHEVDHEITVCYRKGEQTKATRREQRKAERARRNAKVHRHY